MMLRSIAIFLLLGMTTVAPTVAMACATSCEMSGMAAGVPGGENASRHCQGDQPSNDPVPDDSGSMTAMCAVAASAAISAGGTLATPIHAGQEGQSLETASTSFFTHPADEPPIA